MVPQHYCQVRLITTELAETRPELSYQNSCTDQVNIVTGIAIITHTDECTNSRCKHVTVAANEHKVMHVLPV